MSDHEAIIAALLRKAEGTDNAHEAEAFAAKAQELMTRWAIDEAVARSHKTQRERDDEIIVKDVPFAPMMAHLQDGYIRLLHYIAQANGCRVVRLSASDGEDEFFYHASIVGYRNDADNVWSLYTYLFAAEAPLAEEAWKVASKDTWVRRHRNAWQSFRIDHLAGFGQRIGERLQEAQAHVVEQANATALIAVRDKQVSDAMHRFYPNLGYYRGRSGRSYGGMSAGRASGDRVDVGARRVGSARLLGGG